MTGSTGQDILITGLPRSGTTLVVALLSWQANTVALAEPMPVAEFPGDSEAFAKSVNVFFQETRNQILRSGRAPTQSSSGEVQNTNFMEAPLPDSGLRSRMSLKVDLQINKPLSKDFRIYIKHPAAFTAHAETLSARFPLFAVLRDPLSVLASWQTVDLPVNRGWLPVGEKLCPLLRDALAAKATVLDRQVEILGWFLRRYKNFPQQKLIRYEDIVKCPRSALLNLHPNFEAGDFGIEAFSSTARYPSVDFGRLRAALEPLTPEIRHFYPEYARTANG